MENVIRRAVLYCQRGVLSLKDLPSSIRASLQPRAASNFAPQPAYAGSGSDYQGITPGAPVIAPHIGPNGMGMSSYAPQPTYAGQSGGYASGFTGGNPSYSPSYGGDGYSAPPAPPPPPQPSLAAQKASATLENRVDVIEQRIIEDTLRRNNHRRKETAAELGISRVTLYNKMKKFGLL
jgi:DNA-binding NtrC family response regulator